MLFLYVFKKCIIPSALTNYLFIKYRIHTSNYLDSKTSQYKLYSVEVKYLTIRNEFPEVQMGGNQFHHHTNQQQGTNKQKTRCLEMFVNKPEVQNLVRMSSNH